MYDMVDNPSYTKRKSLEANPMRMEVSNSTNVNKSNSAAAKKPSRVRNLKITTAAVIAVCVIAALAAGSMVIALVTHFNVKEMQGEDALQVTSMQAQITKLTEDLTVTQSQLSEIVMGVNRTGCISQGIPGKKDVL